MSLRREWFDVRGNAFCGVALAVGLAVGVTMPGKRAQAAESGALTTAAEQATAGLSTRRRREVDELRRQDIAQTLAEQGIVLRWQDQSLAEITDCRDRFEAARALHALHGIDVDWRAVPLATLIDMRLRAGKADELRTTYGIAIEWRAYSWNDLERLRLSLVAIHPTVPPPPEAPVATTSDSDALAPFDESPSTSSSRHRARRVTTNFYDPDAIIEPLFASDTSRSSSSQAARFGRLDPDAILAPSFEGLPPRTGEGDDLIDPWHAP
jgi:hypothetical protein